ncbi:MAG: hypothetical protein AABZ45_10445 [Pseudomonadota bacterium]
MVKMVRYKSKRSSSERVAAFSFVHYNRTMNYRPAHGALILALLLCACSRADSDAASGGLTVGEAETLERAAERLDERTPSPAAAESQALENDVRTRLDTEIRQKTAN